MHTYKLKFHTVNKERQKLKMKTKRVEMPSLYWQHVDGSFCVKPLKQKQVVSTAAFFFSSSFAPLFTTTAVVPSNTKAVRYFEVAPLRPTSCLVHWFPLTLQVDGVSYLLQEIYGIENKYNSQESKVRGSEQLPVCSSLSDCISEEKHSPWFVLIASIVLLPAGGRRRDQRQQRRVCGVPVGRARHAHSALQTPVSLQRLRRHAALPGQLLPHLQAA